MSLDILKQYIIRLNYKDIISLSSAQPNFREGIKKVLGEADTAKLWLEYHHPEYTKAPVPLVMMKALGNLENTNEKNLRLAVVENISSESQYFSLLNFLRQVDLKEKNIDLEPKVLKVLVKRQFGHILADVIEENEKNYRLYLVSTQILEDAVTLLHKVFLNDPEYIIHLTEFFIFPHVKDFLIKMAIDTRDKELLLAIPQKKLDLGWLKILDTRDWEGIVFLLESVKLDIRLEGIRNLLEAPKEIIFRIIDAGYLYPLLNRISLDDEYASLLKEIVMHYQSDTGILQTIVDNLLKMGRIDFLEMMQNIVDITLLIYKGLTQIDLNNNDIDKIMLAFPLTQEIVDNPEFLEMFETGRLNTKILQEIMPNFEYYPVLLNGRENTFLDKHYFGHILRIYLTKHQLTAEQLEELLKVKTSEYVLLLLIKKTSIPKKLIIKYRKKLLSTFELYEALLKYQLSKKGIRANALELWDDSLLPRIKKKLLKYIDYTSQYDNLAFYLHLTAKKDLDSLKFLNSIQPFTKNELRNIKEYLIEEGVVKAPQEFAGLILSKD